MRVHDDYAQGWNIASQQKDANSVWRFWQNMLKARKTYESLIYGLFHPLDEANEDVYAWIREDKTINQRLLVVLNMGRGDGRGKDVSWTVPKEVQRNGAKLIITNGSAKEGSGLDDKIELSKFEGRVYLLA